jgi:hypothetical protein
MPTKVGRFARLDHSVVVHEVDRRLAAGEDVISQ